MSETPHLLLVDDERSIREPLAVYLTKQGFRVTQAGDAASARTRLAAYAIDLVILDIMMPGEDGLSLCRHVAATSEVPVILLTARAEETDRIVGLEMGADDYVVKPFSPRELATRVKVVLRRPRRAARGTCTRQRLLCLCGLGAEIGRALAGRPRGRIGDALDRRIQSAPRAGQPSAPGADPDQLLDLTQGREAAAFDRAIDNQVSPPAPQDRGGPEIARDHQDRLGRRLYAGRRSHPPVKAGL